MKEIDTWLNHWIHSSIIRARIRKLIVDYARTAFEEGRGEDGFGDYN